MATTTAQNENLVQTGKPRAGCLPIARHETNAALFVWRRCAACCDSIAAAQQRLAALNSILFFNLKASRSIYSNAVRFARCHGNLFRQLCCGSYILYSYRVILRVKGLRHALCVAARRARQRQVARTEPITNPWAYESRRAQNSR